MSESLGLTVGSLAFVLLKAAVATYVNAQFSHVQRFGTVNPLYAVVFMQKHDFSWIVSLNQRLV